MFGILSKLSSCAVLMSCSSRSMLRRKSGSKGSFWHAIPMFSGGLRYVNTWPVFRSSSKWDVLKNSLNVGQLNTIMPSAVSIGSLCSMRSPTLLFEKFGMYQSSAMVPCFLDGFVFAFVPFNCWVHILILCFLGFAICALCHRSCLHARVVGGHFPICFPYLLFSFLRSLLVIVSLSLSQLLLLPFSFWSFLFAVSRVFFFFFFEFAGVFGTSGQSVNCLSRGYCLLFLEKISWLP